MTTSQYSYGNFRRAEEASNAQGTVAEALQFAIDNAKKNPTKANLAILAQTGAARAETTAKQTKKIQDAIAGIPGQISETEKAIEEAEAAIQGVNTAGAGIPGFEKVDTKTGDTRMQDAYQRLYDEFNVLGLGPLVSDAKDLLMKATSIAQMPDALRGTKAYTTRFSANDARIKAGLSALSPAEYLNMEDKYQEVMRQYGLPASYYTTGLYGKQEGFEKLLANDVSNTELEDRLVTAQKRVLNANPEVLDALKSFYPEITNGEILAYTLDPANAIQNIKKKVTAAEIQGAANAFGLNKITAESTPDQIKALEARANALAGYGVDKAAAQEGFETVSDLVPRGSQLADIYGQNPYTQATAESEVFKTSGAAAAKEQRKKLTSLEQAQFGGSSGVGALGRDRGNGASGAGSY